jgi:hypothetical protein
LERSDIEPGIDPEIVGWNRRGNEAGGRGLEDDGSYLDSTDDLVLEPLVVDLNVVVGGEVPLGIVVDGQMDPPSDDAAGPYVHLVVEPGSLESAPAAGVGVEQQGGTTALVAKPIGPELESHLAVERQVGILLREPEKSLSGCRNPPAFRLVLPNGLAIQGQVP